MTHSNLRKKTTESSAEQLFSIEECPYKDATHLVEFKVFHMQEGRKLVHCQYEGYEIEKLKCIFCFSSHFCTTVM